MMKFALGLGAGIALFCTFAPPAIPEGGQTTQEFFRGLYEKHLKADEDRQKAGREAAAAASAGDVDAWKPKHEEYLRRLVHCQNIKETLAIEVVTVPTDFPQFAKYILEFSKLTSLTCGHTVEARLTATALGRAVERLPQDQRADVLAALAKLYVTPLGK